PAPNPDNVFPRQSVCGARSLHSHLASRGLKLSPRLRLVNAFLAVPTSSIPQHTASANSPLTEIDTCLFNGFMSPKTPPGETREMIYQFMRDRLLAGKPP